MNKHIEAAKKGDRQALRELLLQHQTLIESVVHRFAWDMSDMEDVMQNVCVRVVSSISSFGGTCRFSTWLYRIAANECIDANRRHIRRKMKFKTGGKAVDLFPDLNASDGLSGMISGEIREKVRDAIRSLPEGMRDACELYYLHQQTGEEAAATLRISIPAFFVRLSAAREKLKKELKKGAEVC